MRKRGRGRGRERGGEGERERERERERVVICQLQRRRQKSVSGHSCFLGTPRQVFFPCASFPKVTHQEILNNHSIDFTHRGASTSAIYARFPRSAPCLATLHLAGVGSPPPPPPTQEPKICNGCLNPAFHEMAARTPSALHTLSCARR